MISIAAVFVISIIVGCIMICVPRRGMMHALDLIDEQLEQAARTNASLASLYSLLPTFETFIAKGKE